MTLQKPLDQTPHNHIQQLSTINKQGYSQIIFSAKTCQQLVCVFSELQFQE